MIFGNKRNIDFGWIGSHCRISFTDVCVPNSRAQFARPIRAPNSRAQSARPIRLPNSLAQFARPIRAPNSRAQFACPTDSNIFSEYQPKATKDPDPDESLNLLETKKI